VPRAGLAGRRHARDRRRARELLAEPRTQRLPGLVRGPCAPRRSADDPAGRRGDRGHGGRGRRLLAGLGDSSSLAPHRGCFGDRCDGHLPALFRGHQRGVRAWGPVRRRGAVLARSLGDLALVSYRTWDVGFRRGITSTAWLSGQGAQQSPGPGRTSACRRPPPAYAPASLRLPAAPEAQRFGGPAAGGGWSVVP